MLASFYALGLPHLCFICGIPRIMSISSILNSGGLNPFNLSSTLALPSTKRHLELITYQYGEGFPNSARYKSNNRKTASA